MWQQPGSLIYRSEIHCMYKWPVQFHNFRHSIQINTMALSNFLGVMAFSFYIISEITGQYYTCIGDTNIHVHVHVTYIFCLLNAHDKHLICIRNLRSSSVCGCYCFESFRYPLNISFFLSVIHNMVTWMHM